ncbi:AAA family ATPase [Pedobacter sp. SYP-B3415]|uniref:AAA family ATPase n=1 Tax=Pedobacter sp. SYP-B3415 TaxID=2496641 RepID=UPI00101C7926|nr:ATP-binding protein [Pedobacter sp. SYP-B3415]
MYLSDLIITGQPQISLDELFLDPLARDAINQLLKEHNYIDELRRYALPVNNKILLYGSSGCGKTTTAKAMAAALGKSIYVLNLSNVVCARIGETGQNLKMVFDKAAREKAVLFLDEFDQIGKERSADDKDSGEMRRLVNTLIQLIDYFPEQALLVVATNHPDLIDPALVRRFQLRLGYTMPSKEVLDNYYDSLLDRFPAELKAVERRYAISFAEAKDSVLTAVKAKLIARLEKQAEACE